MENSNDLKEMRVTDQKSLPLFRPEAMQRHQAQILGDIVVSRPATEVAVAVILLVFAGLAIIFFCCFPFAQAVQVRGLLLPRGGMIAVPARANGNLKALDTYEGAAVVAGSTIARIETEQYVEEGGTASLTEAQIRAQLEATRSRAAAANQGDLAATRAHILQRSLLLNEKKEAEARLELALAREKLASEAFERAKDLATRGYYPKGELANVQSALLATSSGVFDARGQVNTVVRELATISATIEADQIKLAEHAADQTEAMSLLDERRITTASAKNSVIRSPISGAVARLPARTGSYLSASDIVAYISPAGSKAVAEMYVPSQYMSLIEIGQRINLSCRDISGGSGTISATIRSSTKLPLPLEETNPLKADIKYPVIKVVAAPSDERCRLETGRTVPLNVGAILSGELILGHQTLWARFVTPVLRS